MEERHPPFWAFILIFIGAVFLLNNFNLLPWDSWQIIWRFWPFILIFIGLQMVFGRSRLGRVVSGVISLVLVLIVLLVIIASNNARVNDWLKERVSWWPNVYLVTRQETKTETITVAADAYSDVVKRSLKADLGLAELTLKDDAGTDFLTIHSNFFEKHGTPKLERELVHGELRLNFTTVNEGRFFPGIFRDVSHQLVLGQSELRSDVEIELGTGSAKVDLDSVGLDNFTVEVGTGSADVTLGKAALPTKTMKLDVGTGEIKLVLPKDVGIKINHKVGLGNMTVDGEDLENDGSYISPNYDDAVVKLEIDATVGTGEIEISFQ